MTVPGGARRVALALSIVPAVLALGGGSVTAATITPNTTSDIVTNDGQCSLREAITAAYTHVASGPQPGECTAGTGEDVIHLEPGHYFLSIPGVRDDANLSGDLDIRSNLTIQGAGRASTTIDAVGIDRVIEIMPNVAVRIEGVTITGGRPPAGAAGKEAKAGAPAIGKAAAKAKEAVASSTSVRLRSPTALSATTAPAQAAKVVTPTVGRARPRASVARGARAARAGRSRRRGR